MPFPAKTNPDRVLDQALTIVKTDGLAELSMRRLAADLGLRASSLYRHWADRDTLIDALREVAARQLREAIESACSGRSPDDAFRAASHAYLHFARTQSHLYETLVVPRSANGAYPEEGGKLWQTVLRLVADVTGDPDDTGAAVALWSFLHGFAHLETLGSFGPSGPRGGFDRGIDALLAGFQNRQLRFLTADEISR